MRELNEVRLKPDATSLIELAGAALLPIVGWGVALSMALEPAQWLFPSRDLLRSLSADALLFTAGAAILIAPLAGVTTRSTMRSASAVAMLVRLLRMALVFVGSSALATLAARFGEPGLLSFVFTSHAALASVTLALVLFGALCGTVLRDELDAALCSLSAAVVAAGGVLVAGASVADMPRGLLDAALVASPLVAIASAAQIDLVRTDVLYQISPLAHLGIGYPAWPVVSLAYLLFAAVCFAGLRRGERAVRSPLRHPGSIRTPQMS